MILFSRKLAAGALAVSIGAALFGAAVVPVRAQSVAPPVAVAPPLAAAPAVAGNAAIDPALQKMLMALASAMLANFTASAASGSLDRFDPAPMLESTVKGALNSRELNAALDRLVDQGMSADARASSGASSATGTTNSTMSPEMRALVKAALKGAVTLARTEIAREFAPAPLPAATGSPLGVP